jgi:hypothetical protein
MSNEVGIHKISNELYHSKDVTEEPALSRSTIHDLLFDCPLKAWWNHPALNPDYVSDNDPKYDVGTVAHDILLEGDDICVIIDADDWRKKEIQAQRDEARAEGKTALLRKQYDNVKLMVESATEQIKGCSELGITDLRAQGDSELSYIWKEGETVMKVRPDWISTDRKLIVDYKTTSASANPSEFARTIVSCGYDIQAALYTRGVKAIEGVEPKWVFIVQEVEPPYLCSFIGLPPQFMELGKSKVDYGIFLWNQCMESGIWPAYPNRIAYVEPPAWALTQFEQIAERIGV